MARKTRLAPSAADAQIPELDDLLLTEEMATTGIPAADAWLGSELYNVPAAHAEHFARAWEHARAHYRVKAEREAFLGAVVASLFHDATDPVKACRDEQRAAHALRTAHAARNGAFWAVVETGRASAYQVAQDTGLKAPTIAHALGRTTASRVKADRSQRHQHET